MNKSKVSFEICLAPRDFAADVSAGIEMCCLDLKEALKEAAPSVSTPTTATTVSPPASFEVCAILPSGNRLKAFC